MRLRSPRISLRVQEEIVIDDVIRHEANLRCPFCTEELGLLKDKFGCFVLQIGWVAMFSQDTLHEYFDFRSGAFAECPVDGYAFADLRHEFGGDYFQVVFAHDLQRAVVLAKAS